MTELLVLVHGWSYDARFWDPLRALLPDIETLAWDLGYYGAPSALPPDRPAVAVGHSYGLLRLLHHRPFEWRGLVSINGFSRYAEAPDLPAGVPPAQIDRLAAGVAEAAWPALSGFRQRCGDPTPPPEAPDTRRLQDSLDHLRHWDERPAQPGLALCGETDRVVPPALSRALFEPSVTRWHPGGHLLPRQDPEWCAGELRAWLREHDERA